MTDRRRDIKMGYLVTAENKDDKINLWDIEAEAMIALLSIKISNIRQNKDKYEICNELNFLYLRKKPSTKKSSCTPTLFQRKILNQGGY